jgi:AcrR family transcriptional regulator
MSPRTPAVRARTAGERSLRDHLIATAARLIDERGTAGLTVRTIAGEAQVADGVLYNHFADKEDLLAHALAAHVEAVMRRQGELLRPGHGTVEENLRAFIAHGLDVLTRIVPAFAGLVSQPGVLTRFQAFAVAPGGELALHASLAAYLRAEQEQGRIAADADVDAVVTIIVGACHEFVLPRVLLGQTADISIPAGFDERLATTVLRGIAPGRRSATGKGPGAEVRRRKQRRQGMGGS